MLRIPHDQRLSEIELVLMDIDGTLISGSVVTMENVLRYLRKLKPAGIRFTVATGRTLFGARGVVEQFLSVKARMPPLIAYNGAVVAWPEMQKLVHRFSLPGEAFISLVGACRGAGLIPLVYTCRESLDLTPTEAVHGLANVLYRPEVDFNGMPIRWIEEPESLAGDDVAAVLVYSPLGNTAAVAKDIAARFRNELRVTVSGGTFIEIASVTSNKLRGMEILAGAWGLLPSQIMAIGDSFNDLEMIQGCGYGVAVANAPDEVKAVADHVCARCAAEGVVEALRLLLNAAKLGRIEERIKREEGAP